MDGVRVNALIELLEYSNKEEYEELLTKYTEHKKILQKGITLGELPLDVKAMSELTIKTLLIVNDLILKITKALQKRIKKARLISLIGSLIGVLSSAGLISALLLDDKEITIITASINFFASISVIVSAYIEKSLYGNNTNLNDYIQQVIELSQEANEIDSELKLLMKLNKNEEEIIMLIRRANSISAKINAMRIHVGL